MAVLRLFASAREAAGVSVDRIDAQTVGDVLDEARRRYGEDFGTVLAHSRVWLNGQPTARHTVLREGDVVAVLPPVSGGAAEVRAAAAVKDVEERPATPTATVTAAPHRAPPQPSSRGAWVRPPDATMAYTDGALARAPKPVAPEREKAPKPTPQPTLPEQLPALAVVPDTDRPHV